MKYFINVSPYYDNDNDNDNIYLTIIYKFI